MDGWMDGRMDGVLKNIKIEDYILYAKNNYEGGRKKYIQKENENNLGFYFFFVKKKYPC